MHYHGVAYDVPHRAPEGEGLSEVKLAPLAMTLGVFVVAALSAKFLNDAGFESAPIIVIAAGLLAGSAVTLLR